MKPSRKDYRKYNIKTVEGPDDYASMREVHPACEEGPNGKFARLRHTSAGAKQECDDFGDDVGRSVTR